MERSRGREGERKRVIERGRERVRGRGEGGIMWLLLLHQFVGSMERS